MKSVISFRALFCVVGREDWGFIALVMAWSISYNYPSRLLSHFLFLLAFSYSQISQIRTNYFAGSLLGIGE